METKQKTTTKKAAKAVTKKDGRAANTAKRATKVKAAKKAAKPTDAAKTTKPEKPAKVTKAAKVIALLERKGGATASELMKATGWQAHSLRGFLSTANKKGLAKIASEKREDGERVYSA